MNLLHNMTVNTLYSGDVLCPAELESESLPTKRVSKWPSMLFWIQGVLTIVKPLTHVCCQTSDACLYATENNWDTYNSEI